MSMKPICECWMRYRRKDDSSDGGDLDSALRAPRDPRAALGGAHDAAAPAAISCDDDRDDSDSDGDALDAGIRLHRPSPKKGGEPADADKDYASLAQVPLENKFLQL